MPVLVTALPNRVGHFGTVVAKVLRVAYARSRLQSKSSLLRQAVTPSACGRPSAVNNTGMALSVAAFLHAGTEIKLLLVDKSLTRAWNEPATISTHVSKIISGIEVTFHKTTKDETKALEESVGSVIVIRNAHVSFHLNQPTVRLGHRCVERAAVHSQTKCVFGVKQACRT